MKKLILLITILFFSFGSFAKEPKFEMDGKTAKVTYYYESGEIKTIGFYKNGKMHGNWHSYYPDGSLDSILPYKKGKKDGEFKKYNKKGNIVGVVFYKKDALVKGYMWTSEGISYHNYS